MSFEVKFYNGGDRIRDYLPFTLAEGHDNACIGKWVLDAPAKSFFNVPIMLPAGSGEVAVRFIDDILRKYPDRGVIRIEPTRQGEIPANQPIAKTDDEAVEKGNELWNQYLDGVIRRWYSHCEDVRAAGGAPQEASGFVKRALKIRNMADPGAASREAALQAAKNTNKQGTAPEVSQLMQLVLEMQQQLNDLKRASKLKEEAEAENAKLDQLEAVLENTEATKKSKK